MKLCVILGILICIALPIHSQEYSPEKYFDLAYDLQSKNEYRKAIKLYDALIKLGYKTEKIYFNKGQCHLAIGEYNKAKKHFLKSAKMNPSYPHPWISLAVMALEKEKNYKKALKFLARAQDADSLNHLIYYNAGIAYLKLKDPIVAEKMFLKSYSLNPEHDPTWFYLGKVEFELRNFRHAENFFSKYLQLHPKHPQAYYNRGICRIYQNKKPSGCEDLRKAASLGMPDANQKLKEYCE